MSFRHEFFGFALRTARFTSGEAARALGRPVTYISMRIGHHVQAGRLRVVKGKRASGHTAWYALTKAGRHHAERILDEAGRGKVI